MKIKLIMMTLILSILSMNAMALEGKGVTLLSETIESSPGAVGGFIPSTPKSESKPYLAMTDSQARDAAGKIRENIRLMGNHSFYINNYTSQTQTYTYKYEINCDGQFFRKVDQVSVTAGGYARDAATSYLFTYHDKPGVWTINAVTEVSGESSSNHLANGTLRVSK